MKPKAEITNLKTVQFTTSIREKQVKRKKNKVPYLFLSVKLRISELRTIKKILLLHNKTALWHTNLQYLKAPATSLRRL